MRNVHGGAADPEVRRTGLPIVYDPRAGDNDERSAQKFQEFAQEVGYGSGSTFRDEVISLIRLTATHCTTEHLSRDAFGCEDRHYFLDMGMALLGGTREEYEADALRIRREYGFLPENVYKELRTKILRSFLEIPNIYATPDFRHHFEEQARRNILNEVSRLSGGGDSTDV
ncbi:unnamed protein product [Cyprideis torosa]|uniref:Uncharacterized protein n=1 Tax=Cyprideis torosa TaxID=163714 RepID=A0A7R8ZVN6_9CRUS|nr:unnamed protein product [Cyprideis torosa]CAG0903207.1 unnamed protein product [Cyprideis torosa]